MGFSCFIREGFEYWSNPQNRDEGFVSWMVGDQQTTRMGAGAVAADQGPDGSGVDRRLIAEEPMSIVLNLAISCECLLRFSLHSCIICELTR